MKYTILGILFVAILLFGCVQQEVETPIVDNGEQTIPDETGQRVDSDEEVDEEGIPPLIVEDIVDEIFYDSISQRCTYEEDGYVVTMEMKGDKVRTYSTFEGKVSEIIMHDGGNILYNRGMDDAFPEFHNCDWVKYDYKRINEEMDKLYGFEEEGEYDDYDYDSDYDYEDYEDTSNFICNDVVLDDSIFIPTGNICDGTTKFIESMSYADPSNYDNDFDFDEWEGYDFE